MATTYFSNLSDTLDSCIASLHILLISDRLFNFNNNKLSFDVRFSRYPYLEISKYSFHNHSNI
jgi:hypothetical protein